MRSNVKLFVRISSEIFDPPEPILEIGSLQRPRQEGFADYRPFFKERAYLGSDVATGQGVDLLSDVEKLGIHRETVGTVLIMDTLEHVERPWKALEEIYRVLKTNGLVVMSSHMNFIIHNYPRDHWQV